MINMSAAAIFWMSLTFGSILISLAFTLYINFKYDNEEYWKSKKGE